MSENFLPKNATIDVSKYIKLIDDVNAKELSRIFEVPVSKIPANPGSVDPSFKARCIFQEPEYKYSIQLLNLSKENPLEKVGRLLNNSKIKNQRCLVIANSFCLWGEREKFVEAFFISPKSKGSFFTLAGFWYEESNEKNCTIATCPSNVAIKHIQKRMPGMIHNVHRAEWLVRGYIGQSRLERYASDYPVDEIIVQPAEEYAKKFIG